MNLSRKFTLHFSIHILTSIWKSAYPKSLRKFKEIPAKSKIQNRKKETFLIEWIKNKFYKKGNSINFSNIFFLCLNKNHFNLFVFHFFPIFFSLANWGVYFISFLTYWIHHNPHSNLFKNDFLLGCKSFKFFVD
jgi:hypothetical protein